MPFDPTITPQQFSALRGQVTASARRIRPSEIKDGLMLAAFLAALLVGYEIMEIAYTLSTCDHSRCRVERLKSR